jgi:hypothetical protein
VEAQRAVAAIAKPATTSSSPAKALAPNKEDADSRVAEAVKMLDGLDAQLPQVEAQISQSMAAAPRLPVPSMMPVIVEVAFFFYPRSAEQVTQRR